MEKNHVTSHTFGFSEKIAILRSPEGFSWPGDPHLRNSQNFVFFEIFFLRDVTYVLYVIFEALFKSEFFFSKFSFFYPLKPKKLPKCTIFTQIPHGMLRAHIGSSSLGHMLFFY